MGTAQRGLSPEEQVRLSDYRDLNAAEVPPLPKNEKSATSQPGETRRSELEDDVGAVLCIVEEAGSPGLVHRVHQNGIELTSRAAS